MTEAAGVESAGAERGRWGQDSVHVTHSWGHQERSQLNSMEHRQILKAKEP